MLMERTNDLRWVDFGGQKALQQLWVDWNTGERKWLAVPEISFIESLKEESPSEDDAEKK